MATPIGNLEDLTLRAIRVAVEKPTSWPARTRAGRRSLLRAHGIHTPTTSYFEHNERWKGERILDALREGRSVALVSDAGTPGISDPGYRLVRDARAAELPVVPVPGPSAAIAALSVSGLPSDRFLFVGFLPSRAGARRRALEELAAERATLVVYESPLRVVETLAAMVEVLGDREAFLCREATKLHEEYLRGRLSELHAAPRLTRDREGRDRAGRRRPAGRSARSREPIRSPSIGRSRPRAGRAATPSRRPRDSSACRRARSTAWCRKRGPEE